MRGKYFKAEYLQKIGIAIAIPLLGFALYNNLWAEPEPPAKITPIVIVQSDPSYTELIEELEVMELTAYETEQIEVEEVDTDTPNMEDELMYLAQCVEAEAGNQSSLGKRLVADVILNRVDSPDFPQTITDVINQAGQFNVVDSGAINIAVPSIETWEAVYKEISGMRIDYGILYFQTGDYTSYGADWERVGAHYFSKAQ